MIESLESRRMFAVGTVQIVDGALRIIGTPDADVIQTERQVSNPPGGPVTAELVVTLNGVESSFDESDFTRVSIAAGRSDDVVEAYGVQVHLNISVGYGDDSVIIGDGPTLSFVYGSFGDDTITGHAGDDFRLSGGNGRDEISGGGGNDRIYGGSEPDTLDGGDGNDTLRGDLGNDVIYGRDGNDRLIGGYDRDTLYGGAGNDRFFTDRLEAPEQIDVLDGGDDIDVAYVDAQDLLSFIEVIHTTH